MGAHDIGSVAVLLKREKDYEVAQSLQQALEEPALPSAALTFQLESNAQQE